MRIVNPKLISRKEARTNEAHRSMIESTAIINKEKSDGQIFSKEKILKYKNNGLAVEIRKK